MFNVCFICLYVKFILHLSSNTKNMNSNKSCIERENQAIDRWTSFKLPNKIKPIGWFIAATCFALFLWLSKTDNASFILLYTIKTIGVIGLSMVVLAKEKIEDEMKDVLRGKAMLFAFIMCILFIIITPYITTLLSSFFRDHPENVAMELSHFNMLSCMMLMYIVALESMKRLYQ